MPQRQQNTIMNTHKKGQQQRQKILWQANNQEICWQLNLITMTTTMTIYKEDTDNFNNNIDTANEKNDNNKNSSSKNSVKGTGTQTSKLQPEQRLMKMKTWDWFGRMLRYDTAKGLSILVEPLWKCIRKRIFWWWFDSGVCESFETVCFFSVSSRIYLSYIIPNMLFTISYFLPLPVFWNSMPISSSLWSCFDSSRVA